MTLTTACMIIACSNVRRSTHPLQMGADTEEALLDDVPQAGAGIVGFTCCRSRSADFRSDFVPTRMTGACMVQQQTNQRYTSTSRPQSLSKSLDGDPHNHSFVKVQGQAALLRAQAGSERLYAP